MEYKYCKICGKKILQKETDWEAYDSDLCEEHWTNDERLEPLKLETRKWIFDIFKLHLENSFVTEDDLFYMIDTLGRWEYLDDDMSDYDILTDDMCNLNIFEYEEESRVSILLVSQYFYKHAIATLRNLMEIILHDMYFMNNQNAGRTDKKDLNFKTYRWYLESNGLIEKGESDDLYKLWNELSEYVHCYESSKSNRSFNEPVPGGFDKDGFKLWFKKFIEISEKILKIYKRNYKKYKV